MKDKEREALKEKICNHITMCLFEMVEIDDYVLPILDLIDEKLKNTLTLESKIGESGEEIKEPEIGRYKKFDSSDSSAVSQVYHDDWHKRLKRYNQAPTIKQMPSIIRDKTNSINSFIKERDGLRDTLDIRNKVIREQKEEIEKMEALFRPEQCGCGDGYERRGNESVGMCKLCDGTTFVLSKSDKQLKERDETIREKTSEVQKLSTELETHLKQNDKLLALIREQMEELLREAFSSGQQWGIDATEGKAPIGFTEWFKSKKELFQSLKRAIETIRELREKNSRIASEYKTVQNQVNTAQSELTQAKQENKELTEGNQLFEYVKYLQQMLDKSDSEYESIQDYF